MPDDTPEFDFVRLDDDRARFFPVYRKIWDLFLGCKFGSQEDLRK